MYTVPGFCSTSLDSKSNKKTVAPLFARKLFIILSAIWHHHHQSITLKLPFRHTFCLKKNPVWSILDMQTKTENRTVRTVNFFLLGQIREKSNSFSLCFWYMELIPKSGHPWQRQNDCKVSICWRNVTIQTRLF